MQQGFMQRALLAGIMVAVLCPTIGLFLVLRRLSMIGDTLAHVSLAGVAGGILAGVYPPVMALSFSVLAVLAIEKLRRTYQHYAELSIAIILSGAVGLAGILLSQKNSASSDLMSYLFGSIVAVNEQDLLILAAVMVIVTVTVAILYQPLFYITWQEEKARLSGLPVSTLNLVLLILAALVIASSLRIVGILLVSSLITLPVAASLQWARSFAHAFWLAQGYALTAVILGLALSYGFDWAPGGTIVLMAVTLLILTLLVKWLIRSWRRHGLSTSA
ncbi:zinc transport system permease protein [Heliophilum fasciatum]|uniref:Zinc transport system permease protein n=1 Tax=Heliophilum fasciatum TaxID=35700 RepID=A0A4R2RNN4_9FIRM|nr:zinc transport system permease protein [Heliophilum fasciatum]